MLRAFPDWAWEWWLIAFLAIVLAFVLEASYRQYARGQKLAATASIGAHAGELAATQEGRVDKEFTVSAQRDLAEKLKFYSSNQANVNVLFASMEQRSLAESIVAVFNVAGWQAALTNVPLESYIIHQTYLRESGCFGRNKHLLEAVSDGLKHTGLYGVEPCLEHHAIKKDNPKWMSCEHSIEITIGHRPA